MDAAPNLSTLVEPEIPGAPAATGGDQELALVERCASQLRKALRCACCIAAVPGRAEPRIFSIQCGSSIGKALRTKVASFVDRQMNAGDTTLEADAFAELGIAAGEVLRVETPQPQGVRVVLLAFGVKQGKQEGAFARMRQQEEDLRLRIENARLSAALTRRNSILGDLLRSVSGLNRHLSNVAELLQEVVDSARLLMHADFSALLLRTGSKQEAFAVKVGSGPLADALQVSYLVNRLLHDYEHSRRKVLVDAGPNGEKLMLTLLIQRASPEGVLLFGSRDPGFVFSDDMTQTAELFSDWVAVVIENAGMIERVSASQREWENTFDSIFDPIYLIDAEFRLKKINKALASYAMLSIKLPYNQQCYRLLFHRDTPCTWCPVPRSLRTGQAVVVEAPVFTGGIWQIQSYPFTDKSDVRSGSINVLRDVTLLKRIQEQLIESEKMASTGKLISGVAHEVRNPLFGISTTVRALANELGNKEELKPFLDIVTSETSRLNHLMEELLNYSRPVKIDKNPSDIGEIIREVIGRYDNVPGGKSVTIHLFGAENIPPINIDRNKFHQVILNLVENGIQHSGNEPRIDIFLEYLSLSFPPEIHIVVKDYGSGIASEILPRIFDPFFTTRSRGTGLGLSIVRKVVHDHGGRIALESHPGVGTTVRIVMPVSVAEP